MADNPFASFTPEQKAYAQKYVDANPDASVDDVLNAVKEVSPGGLSTLDKINQTLRGARQEVGGVLNKIDTLGGRMPGGMGGLITTEGLNPVPGSAGDATALLASAAAGGATRGAAGLLPSLARVAAPVAAGGAVDYFANDNPVQNSIWRALGAGGAEVVAGAYGLLKRLRGASALQQPDLKRLSGAVNDASLGVAPTQATPESITRRGESKPSMGNPTASPSLESALDANLKGTFKTAGRVVGQSTNFALPSGGQGPLSQALDEYANLRAQGTNQGQAMPGQGDPRAQAEGLWGQIMTRLMASPDPNHRLVAGMLEQARNNYAQGMSAYRMIQDARTGSNVGGKPLPPIIDEQNGKLNMQAVQARFNALADAGMIDPAVRDQLEKAAFRGGRQPGQPTMDQPGEFRLGSWVRLGHGGVPTIGMHPEAAFNLQFPKHVGQPSMTPNEQPVQGMPRALMSLGALLGMQNLKQILGQ